MSDILKKYTDAELVALEADAIRYRWLRDSAGNDIMRRLIQESSTPKWDRMVDEDRRENADNGEVR